MTSLDDKPKPTLGTCLILAAIALCCLYISTIKYRVIYVQTNQDSVWVVLPNSGEIGR
jgi:cell division protein FtsW (lipid II flippase)